MTIELKTYIVAFIDILGFSSMVKHDCETTNGEQRYVESLHTIYLKTKNLKETIEGLQLIQFSDSVVLAIPYSKDNYVIMLKIISNYQYDLLKTGILCRGGISYGKHFSTEGFLFSNGLIDAYRLESKVASTPRVVVSKELIELIPITDDDSKYVSQERDGVCFVQYLNGVNFNDNWEAISGAISDNLSQNPSIRNKQIWLIDYYNHKYPNNIYKDIPRFNA